MRTLVILLLSLLSYAVPAQENIMFKHLTVHDGLADNEVKCILKDNNGFLWCSTNTAINRYDGYNVKQYPNTSNGLSLSTSIEQIQMDYNGDIWINRYGHYFIYDREKDQFIDAQPLLDKYQLHNNTYPQQIFIDDQKNLWSYNGHIMKYYNFKDDITYTIENLPDYIKFMYVKQHYLFYIDAENDLFITDTFNKKNFYHVSLNQLFDKEKYLDYKFYVDSDLDIWIYSSNTQGLWLLSKGSGNSWELTTIQHISYLLSNKVISICEDYDRRIWIGMEYDGISVYDKKEKAHRHISQTNDTHSLGSNKVWCFYCDKENTMWVGTMRNGISYYNKDFSPFTKTVQPVKHDISCLTEDKDNNLWYGTDGGGIYRIDRNGESTHFSKEKGNSFSDKIVCLYCDSKGRIWVGTYLDGFGFYQDGKFHQYPFSDIFPRNPINNSIWSMTEDREGNLWLGNLNDGLHMYNPDKAEFHTYLPQNSKLGNAHVMSVYFDGKQSVYMATCNGMNIIDTRTKEISSIRSNKKHTQAIKDSVQNNIYVDSRGLIWIGGREGLTVFDTRLDTLYYINDNNSKLKGSLVRGITEDNRQNIWVVTTDGITKIQISTDNHRNSYQFTCHPYSKNDGLQSSDFVHNSIYRAHNGNIMIGGNGGYYSTNPDMLHSSRRAMPVIFTRLKVFNQPIEADSLYDGHVILHKNIELTDKIVLKNSQSTFSLEFSTLEYIRTHNLQFSFRLKETNENWTMLKDNQISFNNMATGTYTLEVRATNSDGLWSQPSSLIIVIEPPIWLSNWFITLYVLIFIAIILYAWFLNDQKHKRRMKYKEIELEAQKQHEIDEIRINFFTNLSHDFRTPLSLIITPLEELLKQDSEMKGMLNIIYKNAMTLLNLVNQILDFRKLEMQKNTEIQTSCGDYVQFANEIIKSFSVYAETNHLSLTLEKQTDSLPIMFDKDKMHKIFMNLLSNAVKYAGNPGKVTIKIWTEKDKVYTSIADNGPGIDDANKSKIFDPFFQIPNSKALYGSGIGLHIVKDLLKAHGGDIYAEDNEPNGTRFIFYIPIISATQETEITDLPEDENIANPLTEEAQELPETENPGKTAVLVVEDYQDLRNFLTDSLKKEYTVYAAVDGLHALSILKKEHIDLIVTDVMMPNMDGIELCRAVKNNIKISHIPIIMLTAKNDIEHVTQGFVEGADDYIQKPFNLDILKLRMRRILKWKQECYRKFAIADIPTSDITSSSLDESFMEKAIKAVEDNIENPQFSVEELSSIVGMSRSNLYNKLMSITGKAPSEFIRLLRLKKSVKYLQGTQMTVAEVAYKVGFNSPKIFTHYFKEEYKMTPTEYRKAKETQEEAS